MTTFSCQKKFNIHFSLFFYYFKNIQVGGSDKNNRWQMSSATCQVKLNLCSKIHFSHEYWWLNSDLLSYASLEQSCLRHSDKTTSHIHMPSEHICTSSDCVARTKINSITKTGNICLENMIQSCEIRDCSSAVFWQSASNIFSWSHLQNYS